MDICDFTTSSNFLRRHVRPINAVVHTVVLVLSLSLIVWISYDTFANIPFLENRHYMTFQLWVCVFFLFDFFLELIISCNRRHYLKTRWLFFLISIPYLNIIDGYNILLPQPVLYYLRFIPLVRGAYSLALVMGYISKNRALSLLWQYIAIMLACVYMLSLLFYYEEHAVNTNVHNFWDALYFAVMNTTTVGCYFSAVTPVGKIVSAVCPTLGMLMLPIFTVYITSWVQNYNARARAMRMRWNQTTAGSGQTAANSGQTAANSGQTTGN